MLLASGCTFSTNGLRWQDDWLHVLRANLVLQGALSALPLLRSYMASSKLGYLIAAYYPVQTPSPSGEQLSL